ncbi:MAG: carbohydrate ABC transporter permease [Clostridiales bacterium]|jgi:raffinose/stachyose/melibiose transport system permease protein|nr:carbohydrate ABC transporter permease [Clostridiales bacterium]
MKSKNTPTHSTRNAPVDKNSPAGEVSPKYELSKEDKERIARDRVLSVVLNAAMWLFTITCFFPMIWMFYSSLKSKMEFNKDVISLPAAPSFSNYITILTEPQYNVVRPMLNSLRTTVASLVLIVAFSFILGYMISRIGFKGNRALYYALLVGMLIPIHSLLVPIYVVFKHFNLNDKWFTLLFPYVSFGLPMGVFLVDSFMKGIPTAMEEAAAMGGSSFHRTLFTVILPICRPILVTTAIIQTFVCWNEFSFALVLLQDPALQTVPLAMTQFTGQFSSDYPRIMAGMLITMLPVVIFYFGFSKQIIEGMVAGAVKG